MLRFLDAVARWREKLSMWIRYAAVSVVATTTGLTILTVLVAGTGMSAGWANVIATAVGTIPSFELNRRWVWTRRGRRSVGSEVLPFCALSLLELLLSTVAVHVAANWAQHMGWGGFVRTTVIVAANVGTFGGLWVAQYVILDRFLFRRPERAGASGRPGVPATAPLSRRGLPSDGESATRHPASAITRSLSRIGATPD